NGKQETSQVEGSCPGIFFEDYSGAARQYYKCKKIAPKYNPRKAGPGRKEICSKSPVKNLRNNHPRQADAISYLSRFNKFFHLIAIIYNYQKVNIGLSRWGLTKVQIIS